MANFACIFVESDHIGGTLFAKRHKAINNTINNNINECNC